MCFVSYVPIADGYILSSNRDEAPNRNSKHSIQTEKLSHRKLYYPADSLGGSWLVADNAHNTVCLLNGAFENHVRALPYRRSRGLVVKDVFDYSDPISFIEAYSFVGIEPFTMIMAWAIYDDLIEFRWDGMLKHVRRLNTAERHCWSSCTLYSSQQRAVRKRLFLERMKSGNDPITDIRDIHLTRNPENLEYGFVMNRSSRVMTLSFTQVVQKTVISTESYIFHENILTNTKEKIKL